MPVQTFVKYLAVVGLALVTAACQGAAGPSASGVGRGSRIAFGQGMFLAVDSRGDVWACSAECPGAPTKVQGLDRVVAVSSLTPVGFVALREDGSVWAVPQSLETSDLELRDVAKISGSRGYFAYLRRDGTVNVRRVLAQDLAPCVGKLQDVTDIAAGNGVVALRKDGTVWLCGDANNWAHEGDRGTPWQPADIPPMSAIAALENELFLLAGDGRIWAWSADRSRPGLAPIEGSEHLGGPSAGPRVTTLHHRHVVASDGTVWVNIRGRHVPAGDFTSVTEIATSPNESEPGILCLHTDGSLKLYVSTNVGTNVSPQYKYVPKQVPLP